MEIRPSSVARYTQGEYIHVDITIVFDSKHCSIGEYCRTRAALKIDLLFNDNLRADLDPLQFYAWCSLLPAASADQFYALYFMGLRYET